MQSIQCSNLNLTFTALGKPHDADDCMFCIRRHGQQMADLREGSLGWKHFDQLNMRTRPDASAYIHALNWRAPGAV